MPTRSISETRRVRYLLGLCSPSEREQIESEYFADEEAFQDMLTAEDDLIDGYARSELSDRERRQFTMGLLSSLGGTDRVQFARALCDAVSGAQSAEPKLSGRRFDIFRALHAGGLFRTATFAAVVVFMALFAWLFIDRWRVINELRVLRAERAQLTKRNEALQQSSDSERPRAAEVAVQLPDLPAQRVREANTEREKIVSSKPEQPENPVIYQSPILGRRFENNTLVQEPPEEFRVQDTLTLQTATTRGGYVGASRNDQSNITLDGVDINEPTTTNGGGATVRGTLRDPQGNTVSGATVTLADPARNFTRTQTSNKDGGYVFTAISPGKYSVGVKTAGFKSVSVSEVAVAFETPTVLDVQLEIGALAETVAIDGSFDKIITRADATLGTSFTNKHITQLPLNAGNSPSLLSLQPGVISAEFLNSRAASKSRFTFNGVDASIPLPSFLNRLKFQLAFETAAIYEDYRVTIRRADGHTMTSIKPLTFDQSIINTPAIAISDLHSGEYVLLLIGRKADGSFVKLAEYFFNVIKY